MREGGEGIGKEEEEDARERNWWSKMEMSSWSVQGYVDVVVLVVLEMMALSYISAIIINFKKQWEKVSEWVKFCLMLSILATPVF